MPVAEIDQQEEIASLEKPGPFKVLCKHCRFHLTQSDFAISIDGHHEHVQCNPHGNTFVFKCYSRVPGSIHSGKETLEHTWFSGFSWQFSHCQNCGEHLGWYFRNQSGNTFFALIADQIIIEDK